MYQTRIPAAGKPGEWTPGPVGASAGHCGGGNGRGGLYDPGAMQLLGAGNGGGTGGVAGSNAGGGTCQGGNCTASGKSYAYSVCCVNCQGICKSEECDAMERALGNAKKLMDDVNRGILYAGIITAVYLLGYALIIATAPASMGLSFFLVGFVTSLGMIAAQSFGYYLAYKTGSRMIANSVSKECLDCILTGLGNRTKIHDEVSWFAAGQAAGLIGIPYPWVDFATSIITEIIGYKHLPTNPWDDWYSKGMEPSYVL